MIRQWLLACLLSMLGAVSSSAVELTRHISREDPLLTIPSARLAVGRDGRVYVASPQHVLRINRDGTGKLGGKVTYANQMAAANADGIIATAHGHFSHSVNLWSPMLEPLGSGASNRRENPATRCTSPPAV